VAERTARVSAGPSILGDKALLGMVARFVGYAVVAFALIVWLTARTGVMNWLQVVTAQAATALMTMTGLAATRSDTLITVQNRQLSVGPDCTGLSMVALFTCLVLAYPVKASSKAIGIVAGAVVLFVANLARLLFVGHLASAPDAVFFVAHDFLFQVGMVVVTVGVWVGWLAFARSRES
jgi:exosortase/archaeosortase family protein